MKTLKILTTLILFLSSNLTLADIICQSAPLEFTQTKLHLKKNERGTYDVLFHRYVEVIPGRRDGEVEETLATNLTCQFDAKTPLIANCNKNPFVDNDKINSYYFAEIQTNTFINHTKKLQTVVSYWITVVSPVTISEEFKKHPFERNQTFKVSYVPSRDCITTN